MANVFTETDPNRNKTGFLGFGTPGGPFGIRKLIDPAGFKSDFDATFGTPFRTPDRPLQFGREFVQEGFGRKDPTLFNFVSDLNAIDPLFGSATQLNLRSEQLARERDKAARDEAIATLTSSKSGIQELLANQQALDFRVVSPAEEQAQSQQIAQIGASGEGRAIQSAASRGVTQAGATLQNVASIRAQTAADDVILRSGIGGQNRNARNQFEIGLTLSLAEIDRQISAIQAGVDFQPSDFLPFAQLGFGAEQFSQQSDQLDRQANSLTPQDIVRLILSLPGTGIPKGIADLFGGGQAA